jgi:hypothetical protein
VSTNDYKREGILKVFTSVRLACAIVVLVLSGSTLPRTATPAAAKPAALVSREVIVILRDQIPDLPAVRGARAARTAAIAAAQAPILSHLQASKAARIRSFAMINAVAATVSPAEADALAAHPLVQAAVPDRILKLTRPGDTRTRQANSVGGSGAAASSVTPTVPSSGPRNTAGTALTGPC